MVLYIRAPKMVFYIRVPYIEVWSHQDICGTALRGPLRLLHVLHGDRAVAGLLVPREVVALDDHRVRRANLQP